MRTKAAVIAVVIAAAMAVGAVGALAAGSQTSAKTVKVTLKEWTLIPSLKRVPAGSVTFVVTNTGKVGHELVVVKTNKAPKALPMNGSLASETGRPASGCRLNFTYDSSTGEVSDSRSGSWPKLDVGLAPAT